MMKRHTCVICSKKRNSNKMINVSGLWACDCLIDSTYSGVQYSKCSEHSDFDLLSKINSIKNKMTLISHLV